MMKGLTQTQQKQIRQEKILCSLEIMKFATREQIQKIHNLGCVRNASKFLTGMREYLQIKTLEGKNVYYLNAKGRDLLGSQNEVKWSLQVPHYLLRNEMYIFFQQPADWRIEEQISFKYKEGLTYQEATIIPDATFQIKNTLYFLEIDRTQSMADNKKKIDLYRLLSTAVEAQYKEKPIVVFYTLTEHRKKRLTQFCSEAGLRKLIYTKDDIQ